MAVRGNFLPLSMPKPNFGFQVELLCSDLPSIYDSSHWQICFHLQLGLIENKLNKKLWIY